ncbi:FecR family protein [Brenneria uluponensis]|uniref:FecR family protein n=1 Tax=Brenneria uluponensis TaxID=3057057 RepID=UPI0028E4DBA2|nr:FecR domain-containing protein [Brenneria ulupoensis]
MPTTQDNAQQKTDIETQAITWLVRLTSGDITNSELATFESWRKSDIRHEAALSEVRRLWVGIGRPLENYYQPDMLNGMMPDENLRRYFLRWQVVLPVVVLLIFSMWMTQSWLSRWQYDQYTTTGEQRMLSLDDGSKMWLDADSAADIRINSGRRFVRLARGEAFFDVVHNPLQPFIVDAGAGEIKALGTTFGVQRDSNAIVVTVEHGKVQLSRKDKPDMVLQADQQIQLHSEPDTVNVINVNAKQALSWHQGQLVFEDQPLSHILSALKRYDKRVIMFNSDKLSTVRLNAIIDIHHLDDWYDGLQRSLPIKISRVGPVVWVRGIN